MWYTNIAILLIIIILRLWSTIVINKNIGTNKLFIDNYIDKTFPSGSKAL